MIAYTSNRMPEAEKNYSLIKLELCGIEINIVNFTHLLKKVEFDAIVDHLALAHIIKSRTEPATDKIKRLLEVLGSYSFRLYYIKGNEMILSEFLSRLKHDTSDPHEIIPISCSMQELLHARYSSIHETE